MKKSILVIDDDALVRNIIVAVLEEEGYEAVAALSFKDALEKAGQKLPDLFLIDVMMPEISGFDACRKIKEMFQPHPPRVIILTGKTAAVAPTYAFKMGADDFVIKTSDFSVLIKSVKNILG